MSISKIDEYMYQLEAVTQYAPLRAKLEDSQKETDRLKEQLDILTKRLGELEALVNTSGGKSIGEIEKIVIEKKEAEIKQRSDERFAQHKEEWSKTEKPKEVSEVALQYLSEILEQLSKYGKYYHTDSDQTSLNKTNLYLKVDKALQKLVSRRLDLEFNRRVEQQSESAANQKLDSLMAAEWPNFVQNAITPKAEELANLAQQNSLSMLRGDWKVFCDKCGSEQSIELTAYDISDLLTRGQIKVECSNPECKDPFSKYHRFPVNLPSLIEEMLAADLGSHP